MRCVRWLLVFSVLVACRSPAPVGAARIVPETPNVPTSLARAAPSAAKVSSTAPPAVTPSTTAGEDTGTLSVPPRPRLFARFPSLRERVAWVSLGELPTPVTHAETLGRALDLPRLYIKRDELSSKLYGGSKLRKLEFLLGAAIAGGQRRVVTVGGVASNQTAATAVFGKQLGLHVHLLLLPQVASDTARQNLLVAANTGATLELAPTTESAERRAEALSADPDVPTAYIPMGASTEVGNLGFVEAALELDAQIARGELPVPDVIYVAMGTMGSAVGLAVGLALTGHPTEVVAVRASNPATSSEPAMQALLQRTLEFLAELDPTLLVQTENVKLRIEESQLGAGYGLSTAEGERLRRLMQQTESVELESTYTAKALAALAARRKTLREATVLFWNTAGRPIDVNDVDPALLPKNLRDYARKRP